MRKRTFVQDFKVSAGGKLETFPISPTQNGRIIAVAIYKKNGENTGIVRASITDGSGEEVAPLCHIDNYRDREAAFIEGKMPVDFEVGGSKELYLNIKATEVFTTELVGDLMLVYQEDYTTNNKNC